MFAVCYAGMFYVECIISLCLITQLLRQWCSERLILATHFESVVPDSVSGLYTLTRNR